MAKPRSSEDPNNLFTVNAQPKGVSKRRRRLFIPRLLREEAANKIHQDTQQQAAQAIVVRWAELAAKGHLDRKETSLDAEFLTEIFCRALGYTLQTEKPSAYTLDRQFSVPGTGTADGAIGRFPLAIGASPVAVIELKATGVDLDRDKREGRTPVQQCWDYLNALPATPWGILSNFVAIRLYHRDRTPLAFEEFKLEDLREPGRFREFYCVFERGGLLDGSLGQPPRALTLLRRTDEAQREVGDRLYDTYSNHRARLIHHLHVERSQPLDAAIRIAQKILDRIIFIAFCEDRDLLPPRAIHKAAENIAPFQRAANPRWRNFLDLFSGVDKGHNFLGLRVGYNGGLFRYDPEVDELQLDDDWTEFFKNLSEYDFRDEVNVDVLGHLFEKSITELEKLRAGGFFESTDPDKPDPTMPKSAERKRFGIYYTPPEFTTFLVRATLGRIIEERFDSLARQHGVDPRSNGRGEEDGPYLAFRRDCLTALRNIKLCDPACGSGAFLIAAYDLLEERYLELADRLELLGRADEADELRESFPEMILADNLYGVDLSFEAVEITQLALWIRSAQRGRTLADLSRHVVCHNSLVADADVHLRAMVWRDTFPDVFARDNGGFDCVVGNPPWERVKVQEREFFAFSAPRIAGAVSAATRRKLIAELERKNPELHERYLDARTTAERMLTYARASDRYPLTGHGDVNYYVLFAELARSIVAGRGLAGILCPSGIASDKTTRRFFNELMDSQTLVSLHDFENRKGLFPDVHRSFKFCTLVFGGSERKTEAADFVFFAHTMDDLEEKDRHIPLTGRDMVLLNPNTRTCPIFRTRRDAELTKAIYQRVPILIGRTRKEGGNPWGIKFVRMFDQTNDAELFHTADRLKKMGFARKNNHWTKGRSTFLPLYEAKMVQMYDHRAAGVVVDPANWVRQGQTDPTTLVQHQNPEFAVEPRWWVDEQAVAERLGGGQHGWHIGYKDVTSPTNERTMIAAFVPQVGLLNSAPLLLTGDTIGPRSSCCLLANLNAFALDYVARQKVGGVHLNFFIVEQLPVLPPDAYADRCPWDKRRTLERWISDRVLKLSCTSNDMKPLAEAAGFQPGVHKWKPDERARLMAELAAAYFILYGISREDAEYILSTFRGTRRRDEADVGRFRTGELILEAYDALRAAP